MAKQSEEVRLRRRKIENRRGVFATWGYPTWESILVSSGDDRDVADLLETTKGVGHVERDITAAVLDGSWEPPLGKYALLVTPTLTDWCYLVTRLGEDEIRKSIGKSFAGRMLATGYQDTAGVVYVRAWDGERQTFDFYTDGQPWEADDDDENDQDDEPDDNDVVISIQFCEPSPDAEHDFDDIEFTGFVADDYPKDWLDQWDSAEQAHQEAVRLFDAYVPGLFYQEDDHELTAAYGHEKAVDPKYIERIDLVRFGKIAKNEPSRENTAAGRRLEKAVGDADLAGVQKAISQGATLGILPDGHCSALWLACYNLCYGNDDAEEIIEALIEAGADPNLVTEGKPEHVVERLIANDRDNDSTPRVLRRLAAAGADLNSESPYMMTEGSRPLHRAAKKARPRLVATLLELGADPLALDGDGNTPRQSVDALLEGKARYRSPDELEEEREDYVEVIDLLDSAEESARS